MMVFLFIFTNFFFCRGKDFTISHYYILINITFSENFRIILNVNNLHFLLMSVCLIHCPFQPFLYKGSIPAFRKSPGPINQCLICRIRPCFNWLFCVSGLGLFSKDAPGLCAYRCSGFWLNIQSAFIFIYLCLLWLTGCI